MANRLNGEVALKIGTGDEEKTLVFRLGLNELIELQSALGYKDEETEKFFADADSGKNLKNLKQIRLWILHALRWGNPEITEQQAGDVATQLAAQHGVAYIGKILREAFVLTMPARDDDQTGKVNAASPSPGKAS
jgi:hypothetical protein